MSPSHTGLAGPSGHFLCGPRDVVVHVGVTHSSQQLESPEHPRTMPARQLAVEQKHAVVLDGRQRRPPRTARQVFDVPLDLRDRPAARRHDQHVRIERPDVCPVNRPPVFARDPKPVFGTESLDALGDPEPMRTQGIGPLETDYAGWGSIRRYSRRDGVDSVDQGRPELGGAGLVIERRTHLVDRLKDLRDRAGTHRHKGRFRIEPFHRGDGHTFGDRTDLTERLGDQYVGFDGGEGVFTDSEGGVFAVSVILDRVIDGSGVIRGASVNRTLGDDWQRFNGRRSVAPVRATDERVDPADASDDLRGAGQQRDGTHDDRSSATEGEKRVRTPAAVSFDLFETLVTVSEPPTPADAIARELTVRSIVVPDDWSEAYGEVHVRVERGEELSLVDHVVGALESREVDADPSVVEAAVRTAFAVPVTTREGAPAAVRAAREVGPVGLLSNCSVPGLVEFVLETTDLPAFDAVVTSVGCGYRKPDRRAFLAMADALAVPLGAIVHVGDDPHADGGATEHGVRAVLLEDIPLTDLPQYFAGAR